MTKRLIVTAAALTLALATLPAQAEVFTITLNNGSSFDTRQQPVEASWDSEFLVFNTSMGNHFALAKADVAEVTILSETKGFGTIINNTTLDLGIMPNDLPSEEDMPADREQSALERAFSRDYDQQQFVDPSDAGGGIPVFGVSGSGTGVIGNEPYTGGRRPNPRRRQ